MQQQELPLIEQPKEHGGTFEKKCKFYAGITAKTCNAGVVMKDVVKPVAYRYRRGKHGAIYTSGHSMPCFKDSDPLNVCSCDKATFPSKESVEAYKRGISESISRVGVARAAIMQDCKGAWGSSGTISCPVCKTGTLRYAVAGCNGHVHARCTTPDCVAWME